MTEQEVEQLIKAHPKGTLFLPKDAAGNTLLHNRKFPRVPYEPSSDRSEILQWRQLNGSSLASLVPVVPPPTLAAPAPKRTTLVGEVASTSKQRAKRISLEDNTFRYMRWSDEALRDEYGNKKLKFAPDLFLWRMFLKGVAYKTGGWLDFEYDYLVGRACIDPHDIVTVARFKKHLLKTILYDFEVVVNADGSKELYSQAVADTRAKAQTEYNRKRKDSQNENIAAD